jgi:hypothetical protein
MTGPERGSAVIEFAVLGTLVFGVLIHALVLFGSLHRATLATSAAAREYGRAVVTADSAPEASMRGAVVVEQAARNHGLAPGSVRAWVEGPRERGAVLTVHATTDVPVLRIPFIGAVLPGVAVPVEARHAVQIDRYRSAP